MFKVMRVSVALAAALWLGVEGAQAAQITITVKNDSSDSSNVNIIDLFANGRRDVNDGNPFALASGEVTKGISINADANGEGRIEWICNPGGSITDVPVRDGDEVKACR